MKYLFNRLKDPTFWLGGVVAVQSINWSSVAPVGSTSWWVSGTAFFAAIAAAIMKNKGEE